MLVRKMTESDVARVALIEKANFSQPWSENAFLTAMDSSDNILVVAEAEGNILGYVCMYVSIDEGEITNVAVDESSRKKGVGVALLKHVFEEAKENDVSRIVLEVRVSNSPAIGLYKKLGFEELGIRKGFYDMPKEDASIMEYKI